MALERFWWNVKIGASNLWPEVQTDDPGLDRNRLARLLRSAVPWLTPATVEGYDLDDFTFLSPSQRDELRTSVEGFRKVAETVPASGHATKEQIQEALPKFRRILEILRPDRIPDVDGFRVVKMLESLQFPEVVKVIWEFDTDATGEPAIRVWVVMKDEVAKRPGFFEKEVRIRDQIDLALRRLGLRWWPYIGFLTASEQRDFEQGVAR
jgi:hypothetical protein